MEKERQYFDQSELEHLSPGLLTESTFAPPVDLSCLTVNGLRAYATTDRGKFEVFPGITNVLDKTTDQEWRCEWYGQVGTQEARRILRVSQAYGTLMHGQAAEVDRQREYNFDLALDAATAFYTKRELFDVNIPENTTRLQEDMLSYLLWCQNVEFEPIGVEIPLVSFHYDIASRVDKFGMITIGSEGYYSSGKNKGKPKGDPRRVFAIIDLKSSRKGYSNPSNALQLIFYEHLLKENYPQHLAETECYLFNWNPKGWETGPNYTFTQHFVPSKVQQEKGITTETLKQASRDELDLCIQLFHLRHSWKKNRKRVFGTYSLKDEVSELSAHFKNESYLELLAQELASELPDELRALVV